VIPIHAKTEEFARMWATRLNVIAPQLPIHLQPLLPAVLILVLFALTFFANSDNVGIDLLSNIDQRFFSSKVVRPPNFNQNWAQSQLTISGLPPTLEVGTNFILMTNIAVDNAGDLTLELVSPSGTTVTIVSGSGEGLGLDGLEPFDETIWSDSYATVDEQLQLDSSVKRFPEAGPQDSFSSFLGEDPNGVWTLRLYDTKDLPITVNDEHLVLLHGWSLHFEYSTDIFSFDITTSRRKWSNSGGAISMVMNGAYGSSQPVPLGTFSTRGGETLIQDYVPPQSAGPLSSITLYNTLPADAWRVWEITITGERLGTVTFGKNEIVRGSAQLYGSLSFPFFLFYAELF